MRDIVLKPHGGLNATGPQCRKAIELVGQRNFTLWYDPGNIYYYSDGKLDPAEDARTVSGIVTGMCVKDFTMSTSGGKRSKDVMVNPGEGKISNVSPVGKALIGKRVGDEVEVSVPAGVLKVRIVGIS